MAGACTCCSFRYNFPLGSEDQAAKGPPRAPSEDSNTSTPFLPVSWAQTPILTPAPLPVLRFTEELCQQLLKTYAITVKLLEQNHGSGPCKHLLKAWFLNFYYGNSHIDYYRLGQQCEDYFETAGVSGPNRISFAALFLRGSLVQCWHQYKRYFEGV